MEYRVSLQLVGADKRLELTTLNVISKHAHLVSFKGQLKKFIMVLFSKFGLKSLLTKKRFTFLSVVSFITECPYLCLCVLLYLIYIESTVLLRLPCLGLSNEPCTYDICSTPLGQFDCKG
jgi:hypothetical protein